MTQSIFPLDKTFDVAAIFASMPGAFIDQKGLMYDQISITHAEGAESWFDSVGSLYDAKQGKYVRQTSDYTVLNQYFTGSYMEEVVNAVKEQAKEEGVKIGRVRLMQLDPKSCYSYHRDPEEFRYHIPLVTNPKCFFVNDMIIEQMPEIGRLYRFRTNDYHTAVNASFEHRVHMLFDTYK